MAHGLQVFYAEHAGRKFFNTLTTMMSSGPVLKLRLRRAGAVAGWRALLGPTDSGIARADASTNGTVRARYGVDKTLNAAHGSVPATAPLPVPIGR
jgi:nucleoside-diphosphate kinase